MSEKRCSVRQHHHRMYLMHTNIMNSSITGHKGVKIKMPVFSNLSNRLLYVNVFCFTSKGKDKLNEVSNYIYTSK
jgi:hypothetical protein